MTGHDELYVMYLDAENALTDTIRRAMAYAVDDGDTKRLKQIHRRLSQLASDVTNPDWLQPKEKNVD